MALYRVTDWQHTDAETIRCQYAQGLLRVTVTDTGMGLVAIGLYSAIQQGMQQQAN
jgi:hypothetical protein